MIMLILLILGWIIKFVVDELDVTPSTRKIVNVILSIGLAIMLLIAILRV